MDVLQVGSKKYVKASVAAANLGYTSDYVGQLCRSGKVDAKLVGRSWYVFEHSIKGHKSARYRSTQTKSIASIKEALQEKRQTVSEVSGESAPHFYAHHRRSFFSPSYSQDTTDLFPRVQKNKNLSVKLADAASVTVTSGADQFVFDTPPAPKIQFKGTLVVNEYDEKLAHLPEGSVLVHPKEVTHLDVEKKPINKVISAKRVKTKIVTDTSSPTTVRPHDHAKHLHADSSSAVTSVSFVHQAQGTDVQSRELSSLTLFFSVVLYTSSLLFLIVFLCTATVLEINQTGSSTTFIFDAQPVLFAIKKFVFSIFNF